MKIKYQISTSYENCEVNFNDKVYSYESLKKILKEEIKIYKKRLDRFSKKKPTSKKIDIEYDRKKFGSSKLTAKEIREYLFSAKQSKAKSWISSQRKRRKEGKLTQDHIDDLNRLGMVWNPTTDDWEKNYNLYRTERLMEVLKHMIDDEGSCGFHWVERFKKLGEWTNEQNDLYEQDSLSKENLYRLQAVDFPLKSIVGRKTSIQLNVLLLIHRIRHLKRVLSVIGQKKFMKYYAIKQKPNVESIIKISEEAFLNKQNSENSKLEEFSLANRKKWDGINKEIEEKERKEIVTKSKDDFKKSIDRICNYEPTRWGEKNNYYENNGKKIPLYISKYHDIYLKLQNYIKDIFIVNTKVEHYEYSFPIKIKFEKEIKIYAAKKMIAFMDDHLLKYGVLNKQKKIEPISYLLDLYNKEKNKEGIVELRSLIEKHELLSLIYRKKIMQVYHKIF